MPEQPTWDKLARKVISLLETYDDEHNHQTYYSYYFDATGVEVLADALKKANASFMWTPVQEVKSAGRRSD